MSLVVLASGGVDSTLVALLAVRRDVEVHPLFIDYGQLCASREWITCRSVHRKLGLPQPHKMDVSGYGRLIPSGLTSRKRRIKEDAFLPGRNLLFALCGAAYAYSRGVNVVAMGLLNDDDAIYPDQTEAFLGKAEETIRLAMGWDIRMVAPLIKVSKQKVLAMAKEAGIAGTYSCHAGTKRPCGKCVSCLEALRSREG